MACVCPCFAPASQLPPSSRHLTLLACCTCVPCPTQVGGYQLHSIEGSVGGAKGVGTLHRGGNGGAAAGGAAADAKRKRDGEAGGKGGAAGKGKEKELTKEEREFMARREAARQRVQQRTAATFGLV